MIEAVIGRAMNAKTQPSSPSYWTKSRLIIWFATCTAVLVNAASVVASVIADASLQETKSASDQVWGNLNMLPYCIGGSTVGTAAKLFFFPIPDIDTMPNSKLIRIISGKATVSMACGMAATPMLLRYMQWPLGEDLLFASSVAMAFMADIVLASGVRIWERWAAKKEEELTK